MSITKTQVRQGLVSIRELVDGTHWIKGTYVSAQYLDGDGTYEDGAIVQDTKVVGCLVGLSRLVAGKRVTYIKGEKTFPPEVEAMPRQYALAARMEEVIGDTIRDGFAGSEMMDEDYSDDLSIEAWNDQNVRTKEQVLEMLDAAIERA